MSLNWHKWRSEGIGSSDAAVVLKISAYDTPFSLWEKKVNKTISQGNYATEHGKNMEPHALKWFESEIGAVLFDNVCRENKEKPWIRATIDGLDIDEKIAVELKCPLSRAKHEDFKTVRKVPDLYYPQVQHQMHVLGLDGMFFASFYNGEGEYIEVERDEKFIANMVKEEEKFWNCVVTKTPPPLTDLDYEEMDDEWIKVAQSRMGLRENIKLLEEKDEELKKTLIQLSRGRNSKGGGLRFTKSEVKGNVDYRAIPELFGVNLDIYRKNPYEKWQLSCI